MVFSNLNDSIIPNLTISIEHNQDRIHSGANQTRTTEIKILLETGLNIDRLTQKHVKSSSAAGANCLSLI